MKLAPYHRFIPTNMRALADNDANDYNLDSIMSGAYAKRTELNKHNIEFHNIEFHNLAHTLEAIGTGGTIYPEFLHKVFKEFATRDPIAGQYQSYGFAPVHNMPDLTSENPEDLAYCVQIPGTNWLLLTVEMRERVLPSISVNRAVADRIQAFRQREDRDPHKKEVAMLKDQVKAKMLATAPIRPKVIPVLLANGLCLTFTSSHTQQGHVFSLLRSVIGTWPAAPLMKNADELTEVLQGTVHAFTRYDDMAPDFDVTKEPFYPAKYAQLCDGESKITIKDEMVIPARGYAMRDAMDRNYRPTELDLYFMGCRGYDVDEDGKPVVEGMGDTIVRLSSNGIIKKIAMSDSDASDLEHNTRANDPNVPAGDYDQGHMSRLAHLWIVAKTLLDIVHGLDVIGALKSREVKPEDYSDTERLDAIYVGDRPTEDDETVLAEIADGDTGVERLVKSVENFHRHLSDIGATITAVEVRDCTDDIDDDDMFSDADPSAVEEEAYPKPEDWDDYLDGPWPGDMDDADDERLEAAEVDDVTPENAGYDDI